MKRRRLFTGAAAVALLPAVPWRHVDRIEAPKRVITLDRSGVLANPMPHFEFRGLAEHYADWPDTAGIDRSPSAFWGYEGHTNITPWRAD